MIVVVNSRALIGLARIRELEILQQLYGLIYVSAPVYNEIVVDGKDMPGAREIRTGEWIQKKEIKEMTTFQILQIDLDPGEAGTIVVAIELNADLTILDEVAARRMGNHMGLNIIGTIGVLIDAKKLGIIANVKSYMDRLREAEFWISDNLYKEIIQRKGEF